jgi:hypothetical protein
MTAQDDTYLDEMTQLVLLKGMTISGAAAKVAELHGFPSEHDAAVPQRLAQKYRTQFGRKVIRVLRHESGFYAYIAVDEDTEALFAKRFFKLPSVLPSGWKYTSVIHTRDRRSSEEVLQGLAAF